MYGGEVPNYSQHEFELIALQAPLVLTARIKCGEYSAKIIAAIIGGRASQIAEVWIDLIPQSRSKSVIITFKSYQ